MRLNRPLTAAIGTLAIGAILGGCAALDLKEREWVFNPIKQDWHGYSGLPDGTQEFWLDVASGRTVATQQALPSGEHTQWIHAWWMPAADPAAPAMLYLHGARWNLTGSTWRTQNWRELGFSVLAIDYRGFGKSSGDLPSEQQSYEDAAAAWKWLKHAQPDPRRRLIYGHSLGGAVAIDLAAKVKPDEAAGLIAESTFTSIPDMIKASKWGFLPVGFLVTQRFDSEDKIARVKLPKLFIHGTADRVVPLGMSEELFRRASEPKRLIEVEGAGHSNSSISDFDAVGAAALEMVKAAGGAAPQHAAR